MDSSCDFCSYKVFEKQMVYESESVRVLYPLKPVVFGHFMIMPKRHVAFFTDLNDDEVIRVRKTVSDIFELSKIHFETDGFNVLNNNGLSASQHIPHMHIHVFMRKDGDVSPFDRLSKRVTGEELSSSEWNRRIDMIRSCIESTGS